ncbi:MAG: replication initiator protein [Microvirus sp.]|nr:MAG: replication initiator protein [Microvirus sp.]
MGCNYPVPAFRLSDGSVTFNRQQKHIVSDLHVPCGQCIGCKLERSRQWAVRCMHEASLHELNCFITLTYNDAHIPKYDTLDYTHFQKFMKRFRKRFPCKEIRFFMCGEYGEKNLRPHFHACIFNFDFIDKEYYKTTSAGSKIYTSKLLDALWSDKKKRPIGFTTVGQITFDSAGYVARYIMKKGNGRQFDYQYESVDEETGEIHYKKKEFNKMSLRPGIGTGWYKKWKSDIFPADICVINGVPTKPPKFYYRKLKQEQPEVHEQISADREQRAKLNSHDNTEDRLLVKEKVLKARLQLLQREI